MFGLQINMRIVHVPVFVWPFSMANYFKTSNLSNDQHSICQVEARWFKAMFHLRKYVASVFHSIRLFQIGNQILWTYFEQLRNSQFGGFFQSQERLSIFQPTWRYVSWKIITEKAQQINCFDWWFLYKPKSSKSEKKEFGVKKNCGNGWFC